MGENAPSDLWWYCRNQINFLRIFNLCKLWPETLWRGQKWSFPSTRSHSDIFLLLFSQHKPLLTPKFIWISTRKFTSTGLSSMLMPHLVKHFLALLGHLLWKDTKNITGQAREHSPQSIQRPARYETCQVIHNITGRCGPYLPIWLELINKAGSQ